MSHNLTLKQCLLFSTLLLGWYTWARIQFFWGKFWTFRSHNYWNKQPFIKFHNNSSKSGNIADQEFYSSVKREDLSSITDRK